MAEHLHGLRFFSAVVLVPYPRLSRSEASPFLLVARQNSPRSLRTTRTWVSGISDTILFIGEILCTNRIRSQTYWQVQRPAWNLLQRFTMFPYINLTRLMLCRSVHALPQSKRSTMRVPVNDTAFHFSGTERIEQRRAAIELPLSQERRGGPINVPNMRRCRHEPFH